MHWRDLPDRFEPWKTVYKRHRLWSGDGTWERLLQQVQAAAPTRIPGPGAGKPRVRPDGLAAGRAYSTGPAREHPRRRGLRHSIPERDSQASPPAQGLSRRTATKFRRRAIQEAHHRRAERGYVILGTATAPPSCPVAHLTADEDLLTQQLLQQIQVSDQWRKQTLHVAAAGRRLHCRDDTSVVPQVSPNPVQDLSMPSRVPPGVPPRGMLRCSLHQRIQDRMLRGRDLRAAEEEVVGAGKLPVHQHAVPGLHVRQQTEVNGDGIICHPEIIARRAQVTRGRGYVISRTVPSPHLADPPSPAGSAQTSVRIRWLRGTTPGAHRALRNAVSAARQARRAVRHACAKAAAAVNGALQAGAKSTSGLGAARPTTTADHGVLSRADPAPGRFRGALTHRTTPRGGQRASR
ncbi:transposase [Streptomyces rubiginosohelvolus]|uniref:transposase n=1 Tax=Streptomyces rubiginosohelvolus TaxID=67362 RepID=UPI0034136A82